MFDQEQCVHLRPSLVSGLKRTRRFCHVGTMPIFHLGSPRKTDPTKCQVSLGKFRKKRGLGGVRFIGPMLGLCWSVLGPLGAMLGPCWAYVGGPGNSTGRHRDFYNWGLSRCCIFRGHVGAYYVGPRTACSFLALTRPKRNTLLLGHVGAMLGLRWVYVCHWICGSYLHVLFCCFCFATLWLKIIMDMVPEPGCLGNS